MGLNIKNEKVHELIRELAARTGKSQTSAVEEAVRRRLEEFEQDSDPERRQALERAVENLQNSLTEEDRGIIRNAEKGLYDKLGLPR